MLSLARLDMPTLDGIDVFTRDTGQGPGVLLVHGSGSTGGQWRWLAEALASGHRVLAPDLYGHGRTPVWPGDPTDRTRPFALDDEARLLAAVAELTAGPVHVVGHSYGAAACLQLARRHAPKVRSLTLFEPTLFRVLPEGGRPEAWDEVYAAAASMMALTARGQVVAGARRFVGYLMGEEAWDALPPERRAAMAALMPVTIVRECRAQMLDDAIHLRDYAALDMPTTFVVGTRSPPAIVAVSELLAGVLPSAGLVRLPGAGHMAPLTDPEAVEAIVRRAIGG